ncbi:Hint domain-containing protein [Jannaschia marina]|uniref:Hint domain-containing protein n=1 Tax=Jannaschia marina TaxID=2741674 RepID=UPI0015CB35ED|nr:Hint domain-containing protein [Jannaschia marina]
MSEQRLFTHDAFPVIAPVATRFTPGTRLATPEGERPVEGLAVGDAVLTRSGPRRIARVDTRRQARSEWTYDRPAWPIRVPVGSLGNPRPLRLAPDLRVLLSGPTVHRICEVEEISVMLRDLVGLRGLIVERPLADLCYHGLSFGIPAVVEAEGAACEVEGSEGAVVAVDLAREAYHAMHAAGEPPLRG